MSVSFQTDIISVCEHSFIKNKKIWLGKGETVSVLKDSGGLKIALGSLVHIRDHSLIIQFDLQYFQQPVEVVM